VISTKKSTDRIDPISIRPRDRFALTLAPNAAVDEVSGVQDCDRYIDGIRIPFELNLNLFCDGFHVWFPIGFSNVRKPKN
jgi:hypothetical protein